MINFTIGSKVRKKPSELVEIFVKTNSVNSAGRIKYF